MAIHIQNAETDWLVRDGDQSMTDADYSNLIVACKTSTMRSNSAWRDVLDELANRLKKLQDQQGTEGERYL